MHGTNSATTAPISAKPLEMREPPKKCGRALGMRNRTRVWQRVASFKLNKLSSSGLTLRIQAQKSAAFAPIWC